MIKNLTLLSNVRFPTLFQRLKESTQCKYNTRYSTINKSEVHLINSLKSLKFNQSSNAGQLRLPTSTTTIKTQQSWPSIVTKICQLIRAKS